jgi:hypothetical protein
MLLCVSEETFTGSWKHGYHFFLAIRCIKLMCTWPKSVVKAVYFKTILSRLTCFLPIPVAERSKKQVCGPSIAGIAGSNTVGVSSSLVFIVFFVGSGHCDELITCTEESYRVYMCVIVWSTNLNNGGPRPNLGCCATEKTNKRSYSLVTAP